MLDDELKHVHDSTRHPLILQHLEHADPSVRMLVMPHLESWVRTHATTLTQGKCHTKPTYGVERLLRLVRVHGSPLVGPMLRKLSLSALEASSVGGWELLWFSTLFSVDPVAALPVLMRRMNSYSIGALGEGAFLIGSLFGDRHEGLRVNPRDLIFSPPMLLQLVLLAYAHVRREDDIRHAGTFTPGARDAAEVGRNELLNALLATDGPAGWDAKMKLGAGPAMTDFADRARAISLEHAAAEVEGTPLSVRQAQAFMASRTVPPMTRDQMFDLLQQRLDALEDHLDGDASPRVTWARVRDEHEMRRLITGVLEGLAHGAYLVPQENVTAEEKETDIRIVSTMSTETGVIELKIGDNGWSGKELRDTINNQLVTKYLRPNARKAGGLLVTVAKRRKWIHPDTGKRLDIGELRIMLSEEAQRVERAMGGTVRLATRVLDLESPLLREPKKKAATSRSRAKKKTRKT